MGHGIKLSKQLTHGNGFGVYYPGDNPLIFLFTLIAQHSHSTLQSLKHLGLATKRLTHKHEAMAHNHHLISLDNFLLEKVHKLQIFLKSYALHSIQENFVVRLR